MPKLNTYAVATEVASATEFVVLLPGSNDTFEVKRVPRTVLATFLATLGIKGDDGDPGATPILRKGTTAIEWTYVGSNDWTSLITLAEMKGDKGTGLTPRGPWVEGTYQPGDYVSHNGSIWFLLGSTSYNSTATPGTDLTHWQGMTVPAGVDGREVHLQVSAGKLQWQYTGDTAWVDLLDTTALGLAEATYEEAIAAAIGTKAITPRRLRDFTNSIGVDAASLVVSADLNLALKSGAWNWTDTSTHTPVAGSYGRGMTLPGSADYLTQIGIVNGSNAIYLRFKEGTDTWKPWVKVSQAFPAWSDLGNAAAASTKVLDLAVARSFRFLVQGAMTVSFANWPEYGQLAEISLEVVNGGAFDMTFPGTVNWVKSDGTITNNYKSLEEKLQAAGTDWIQLWTRDAGNTIWGRVVRGKAAAASGGGGAKTPVVLPFASIITLDATASDTFLLTLGGHAQVNNPTGLVDGQTIRLYVKQHPSGGLTLANWGNLWKWEGGTAPVLSTAGNAIDVFEGQYLSGFGIIAARQRKGFA